MTSIKQPMMTAAELSGFCTQMAMLLDAGIPAAEGLAMLCDDSKDAPAHTLLEALRDGMGDGLTLSAAMSRTEAFPRHVLVMAEIGEQSGKLDEVLTSLSDYYEREQSIAASIRSAVTYPMIMLTMMLLVVAVLAIRVLPIFQEVFAQLGADLSSFTQGVLQFGSALGGWSVGLIALLLVVTAALLILRATPDGRKTLTRFLAKFPPTKKLSVKISTGRFAGAMALMLSSGVDPDHSLELAAKLIDHPELSTRIEACREQVSAGLPFAKALFETRIFSGVNARMISIGFLTGSADTVMKKLADRSEEEIDAELSALVGIVEPTLVAILSVAVGLILLSVMLPLMGIMSSMG